MKIEKLCVFLKKAVHAPENEDLLFKALLVFHCRDFFDVCGVTVLPPTMRHLAAWIVTALWDCVACQNMISDMRRMLNVRQIPCLFTWIFAYWNAKSLVPKLINSNLHSHAFCQVISHQNMQINI